MGEAIRVTRSCEIDADELEWRFVASGGPGGQHANRSNTKAELTWSVEDSPSLGPRQRARLLEKLGPVVRVTADDERSQARNRALALDRFRSRLAIALHVDPPRHATKPSRAAKARRVESKKRRGDVKRLRRPPSNDPD